MWTSRSRRVDILATAIGTVILGVCSNWIWAWMSPHVMSRNADAQPQPAAAAIPRTSAHTIDSTSDVTPDATPRRETPRRKVKPFNIDEIRMDIQHLSEKLDPVGRFEAERFHRLPVKVQDALKIGFFGGLAAVIPIMFIWVIFFGPRKGEFLWRDVLEVFPAGATLAACLAVLLISWVHIPVAIFLIYKGAKRFWITFYENVWKSHFVQLDIEHHFFPTFRYYTRSGL